MPKLIIQLITYNSAKYIPYLFKSLRAQTFKNWDLLVVDNTSSDNTIELLKKELADFPLPTRLIQNTKNKGFAGGHNQAFRESNSEYFLLLNPDLHLESDCLEKLVKFLDEHPEAAAVAPRLMRWSPQFPSPLRRGTEGEVPTGFTNKIDALGLKVFRNRRIIEQGSGEEWAGLNCHPERNEESRSRQLDSSIGSLPQNDNLEVFGVSGTLVLLRRSATQEILYNDGNVFDESLHTYKEDVDLAYRLRSHGYRSFVLTNVVAYHNRGSGVGGEVNDWSAAANKEQQSAFVRYHSYKNHLATLYKNEYWQNFLLDFFWIMWYELKKFGWLLLFDRPVVKGLGELWRARKSLKIKRLKIKGLRKVSWRQMRKLWS
ncbi:MAG: glycosyltransferase [Candidatus Magasanikbacteria bacterium]|nr:glycosyltransferase [Candidatus Magasanikbacteria bacterium]